MANKKGPLSVAEKFYIQEHAKLDQDIGTIATALERSEKVILRTFNKARKEWISRRVQKASTPPPTTVARKEEGMVSKQFIRKSGCTVMTENASTIADATRGRRIVTTGRSSKYVTKARPDVE